MCEALVCYGALARLIDFSNLCRVVFDTLYLLLSFGHETPEEADKLDPPFSYFRLRLVCSLLETCGQFFNKGLAKKRLDRFLTFFQRYLLAKPPLPLDVEFDVQVCSLPLNVQVCSLHLNVQVCSLYLCKAYMSTHALHSILLFWQHAAKSCTAIVQVLDVMQHLMVLRPMSCSTDSIVYKAASYHSSC